MATTPALTMFLNDSNIVLEDKSTYAGTHEDFGRAFFIRYGEDTAYESYNPANLQQAYYTYENFGRHNGMMFLFPVYNPASSYSEDDIVAVTLWEDAEAPQDQPDSKRGHTFILRLVRATEAVSPGQTPQGSDKWEFLDDAYTECLAAANGLGASAILDVDGEINIVKEDDYKYRISHGKSFDLYVYSYENPDVELLSETNIDKTYTLDTKALLGDDPYDILIVKIDDGSEYYGIIYEITKLVRVVNDIVLTLYCVENEDVDCRDVTFRQKEFAAKQMGAIMVLYNSIFWKINNKYAKNIYIGSVTTPANTIIQEIQKEMRRLKVILDNYEN